MLDFSNYKIIVIKIGSALIIEPKSYQLRRKWLENLAKEVSVLKQRGHKVVIVSSGSIICGCKILEKQRRDLALDQLQAVAAFGQVFLIEHFKNQFNKHNLSVAQMLITSADCQHRRRYLNMRDTLDKLLEMDIVPIINENDSVITEEIRFGDNDRLSAQVAQLINAELLIILSDIDGLYDKNPKESANAKLIKEINHIDNNIISMAQNVTNDFGTGGMASKIKAAQIAVNSGTDLVITKGTDKDIILALGSDKKYSIFKANINPVSARKKWLSNLDAIANIVIDNGAREALQDSKSLLPVGVLKYQGGFERGDILNICDEANNVIAKAISEISSEDLSVILGKTSQEIIKLDNNITRKILVHCNNLVLL
jgi:glutamate 5-kinase